MASEIESGDAKSEPLPSRDPSQVGSMPEKTAELAGEFPPTDGLESPVESPANAEWKEGIASDDDKGETPGADADSLAHLQIPVSSGAILEFLKTIRSRQSDGAEDETASRVDPAPTTKSEPKSERKVRNLPYVSELVEKASTDELLIAMIEKEISEIVKEHDVLDKFEVMFIYDHAPLNRTHASAMYQGLSICKRNKDVLVVLKSVGGKVEPAYLMSKLCNRFKKNKFFVVVPAEAKSAATLFALGADEIHMGAMSELGPIDPQINDYPALAFSSALEKIAQIAQLYPGASDMLARYLKDSGLNIQDLGHYDRITESSTQYAMRLLESKIEETEGAERVRELASYFTNHYKDHNFVIDVEEAQKLLSKEVVKSETDIYHACHEVHRFIELAEFSLSVKGRAKKVVAMGRRFHLRTLDKAVSQGKK